MTANNVAAYYRVSTARQGASGLGLDAQRNTVMQYLAGGPRTAVGEFCEVETGKGCQRPGKAPSVAHGA